MDSARVEGIFCMYLGLQVVGVGRHRDCLSATSASPTATGSELAILRCRAVMVRQSISDEPCSIPKHSRSHWGASSRGAVVHNWVSKHMYVYTVLQRSSGCDSAARRGGHSGISVSCFRLGENILPRACAVGRRSRVSSRGSGCKTDSLVNLGWIADAVGSGTIPSHGGRLRTSRGRCRKRRLGRALTPLMRQRSAPDMSALRIDSRPRDM